MLTVWFFRRAEIHRDAVLDHFVLFEDLIEDLQRASTIDHEIFRDDFKPVAYGLAGQNVVVVRGAQTDPDAVFGESIELIRRHYQSPGKLEGTRASECFTSPRTSDGR